MLPDCPEIAYNAQQSTNIVSRLLDAGAILIDKTNMDQLATGLVSTRSPYDTSVNGFNKDDLPGGSSSGSAVAVSCGLVSFALGIDSAGSGRVPACRSLDCVSVFNLFCADAASVAAVMVEHDTDDAFSRAEAGRYQYRRHNINKPRIIVVPQASDLRFLSDDCYHAAFHQLVDKLAMLSYRIEQVDYSIFKQATELIYDGPWINECGTVFRCLLPPARAAKAGDEAVHTYICPAGSDCRAQLYDCRHC